MSVPTVRLVRPASTRAGRRAADLGWLVGGLLLLGLATLPVRADSVPDLEGDVFRLLNGTVVLPFAAVWVVMQLGNVLVIPITAGVAAAARRFRLALGILAGGLVTYWLAKVVKSLVTRGRPGALLDDVELRSAPVGGLGFVSGHAAVIVLIVVVALSHLGRRARWAACTAAALVCLTRVYVGAHLPLDVVGGAGLGLAVGGAVRLLTGRPGRHDRR